MSASSQFGDNHQAIKEFFPNAQLFGFTGTPIFMLDSTQKQITGEEKTLRTTEDLFQKELHQYTITHAIEDRNVLGFHVDYYKPKSDEPKPDKTISKQSVINTSRASSKHIETMDLDRLISLWQEHYEKLTETGKALLPWPRCTSSRRQRH